MTIEPGVELRLPCGVLRVAFSRFADRVGHRVEWTEVADESNGSTAVLQSLEGSAVEPWPPSPTLQQIHFERRARSGGETPGTDPDWIALLVGQAGRSHWSLSVAPSSDGEAIEFDVACRVATQPDPRLFSSYESPHVVELVGTARASIAIDADRALAVEADEATTRITFQAGRLILEPTGTTGTTRRWKYSLRPISQRT